MRDGRDERDREEDIDEEWNTAFAGESLPSQSGLPTDCRRITVCFCTTCHCCQAKKQRPVPQQVAESPRFILLYDSFQRRLKEQFNILGKCCYSV